ncbi:MAG: patatin-like phospholipase family protein [Burkholderiaceae bacterium]|nr:patatin-like phospholipase family protein [Burkholderiaceae bacterium]
MQRHATCNLKSLPSLKRILARRPAKSVVILKCQAGLMYTPDLPVAIAARASASIPIVYSPVQLTKESVRPVMLMDGGMVNNIPIDQLTIDSVPRLGIQLVSKSSPLAAGSHSLFDIAPRVINLMMSSNENTHIDLGLQIGAQVAFVETGYAGGLDRNMSTQMRQRLFDDGYAATTLKLAEI